eukprot:1928961-Alexandrium_andersonii.AAC.1
MPRSNAVDASRLREVALIFQFGLRAAAGVVDRGPAHLKQAVRGCVPARSACDCARAVVAVHWDVVGPAVGGVGAL